MSDRAVAALVLTLGHTRRNCLATTGGRDSACRFDTFVGAAQDTLARRINISIPLCQP